MNLNIEEKIRVIQSGREIIKNFGIFLERTKYEANETQSLLRDCSKREGNYILKNVMNLNLVLDDLKDKAKENMEITSELYNRLMELEASLEEYLDTNIVNKIVSRNIGAFTRERREIIANTVALSPESILGKFALQLGKKEIEKRIPEFHSKVYYAGALKLLKHTKKSSGLKEIINFVEEKLDLNFENIIENRVISGFYEAKNDTDYKFSNITKVKSFDFITLVQTALVAGGSLGIAAFFGTNMTIAFGGPFVIYAIKKSLLWEETTKEWTSFYKNNRNRKEFYKENKFLNDSNMYSLAQNIVTLEGKENSIDFKKIQSKLLYKKDPKYINEILASIKKNRESRGKNVNR